MGRLVASAPLFALAVFFAIRSWNPLGNGYLLNYKDSPDGVYVTMAGIGISIAALFAAAGLVFAWPSFRQRGGLLVVAALATIAGVLPYVLFKWTSEPETWPWAFLVDDWISWLRFAPRPRRDGLVIQAALAAITFAAIAAHVGQSWSRARLRSTAHVA